MLNNIDLQTYKPIINADFDYWGVKLNKELDIIESSVNSVIAQVNSNIVDIQELQNKDASLDDDISELRNTKLNKGNVSASYDTAKKIEDIIKLNKSNSDLAFTNVNERIRLNEENTAKKLYKGDNLSPEYDTAKKIEDIIKANRLAFDNFVVSTGNNLNTKLDKGSVSEGFNTAKKIEDIIVSNKTFSDNKFSEISERIGLAEEETATKLPKGNVSIDYNTAEKIENIIKSNKADIDAEIDYTNQEVNKRLVQGVGLSTEYNTAKKIEDIIKLNKSNTDNSINDLNGIITTKLSKGLVSPEYDTAKKIEDIIKSNYNIMQTKVAKSDIVDNLTTEDNTRVASASTVKILNDKIVATNNNVTNLDDNTYKKNEIDNKISALVTGNDWKEAVNKFEDLATTYPNPEKGWTVNVMNPQPDGTYKPITYQWDGQAWIPTSINAIPDANPTTTGLMTKEYAKKLEDVDLVKISTQSDWNEVNTDNVSFIKNKPQTITESERNKLAYISDTINEDVAEKLPNGLVSSDYDTAKKIEDKIKNNYTLYENKVQEIDNNLNKKLDKTSVLNVLTSTSETDALSANMGRELFKLYSLSSVTHDFLQARVISEGTLLPNETEIPLEFFLNNSLLFINGQVVSTNDYTVDEISKVIRLKNPVSTTENSHYLIYVVAFSDVKFVIDTVDLLLSNQDLIKILKEGDVVKILGKTTKYDGQAHLRIVESVGKLNAVPMGDLFLNEIPESNMFNKADKITTYTKTEIDTKFQDIVVSLDWKESVETFEDIAITYPNPEKGWTVGVSKPKSTIYRYDGTDWVNILEDVFNTMASETDNGLMSSSDFTKLKGLKTGAEYTIELDSKVSKTQSIIGGNGIASNGSFVDGNVTVSVDNNVFTTSNKGGDLNLLPTKDKSNLVNAIIELSKTSPNEFSSLESLGLTDSSFQIVSTIDVGLRFQKTMEILKETNLLVKGSRLYFGCNSSTYPYFTTAITDQFSSILTDISVNIEVSNSSDSLWTVTIINTKDGNGAVYKTSVDFSSYNYLMDIFGTATQGSPNELSTINKKIIPAINETYRLANNALPKTGGLATGNIEFDLNSSPIASYDKGYKIKHFTGQLDVTVLKMDENKIVLGENYNRDVNVLCGAFTVNDSVVWTARNFTPSNYMPIAGGNFSNSIGINKDSNPIVQFNTATGGYQGFVGRQSNSIRLYNNISKKYISLGDDGVGIYPATNLNTTSKEVVEAINELKTKVEAGSTPTVTTLNTKDEVDNALDTGTYYVNSFVPFSTTNGNVNTRGSINVVNHNNSEVLQVLTAESNMRFYIRKGTTGMIKYARWIETPAYNESQLSPRLELYGNVSIRNGSSSSSSPTLEELRSKIIFDNNATIGLDTTNGRLRYGTVMSNQQPQWTTDPITHYFTGNILSTGTIVGTNVGTTSDVELKTNIQPIDANVTMDKFMKINFYSYNFKNNLEHKEYGVIAQEIQDIYPELVLETDDKIGDRNVLAVNYKDLYIQLAVVVQEQEKRIKKLEKMIENK